MIFGYYQPPRYYSQEEAPPETMNAATYHPDPEINALVTEEANDAERANLAAGLPPSWWLCPDCGAKHNRGHYGNVGCHRCMNCGYAGGGGVMAESKEALDQ